MHVAPEVLPMIAPGDTFDRYRIVRKLGEGGMATVYEAQNAFGIAVVLKVLNPDMAADPDIVERFRREGRIQYTLRHPHIVRVTDIIEHRGLPALVIDLMRGEDLDHALRGGRVFELAETLDLMVKLLDALAAAHERGFIHRDIKPANVFLDRTDQGFEPRLMDFGIAKIQQATALTRAQEFCGTPSYSSPEQIESTRDVDARTDVYSMGMLLWRLLSDREPYEEHTDAIRIMVAVVREPLPELPPGVPLWLRQVLGRATAKKPNDRFPSAAAFRDALLEGIRADAVLQQTVLLSTLPKLEAAPGSGAARGPAPPTGPSDAARIPAGRATVHTPIGLADTATPGTASPAATRQLPAPGQAVVMPGIQPTAVPASAAPAREQAGATPRGQRQPAGTSAAPGAPAPAGAAPSSSASLNAAPAPPRPPGATGTQVSYPATATVVLPQKKKPAPKGGRRVLAAAGGVALVAGLAAAVAVMAWDVFTPPQQLPAGFVRIEPGTYVRGSADDEPGRGTDETRQQVTISYPLAVQQHEVTVAEFDELMFGRSSPFSECGPTCPAVNVAWQDAIEYANMRSIRDEFTPCYRISGSGAERRIEWPDGVLCDGYRLPTEAEWEYFARAGSATALHSGPLAVTGRTLDPALDAIAVYGANSGASYAGGIDCARWGEGFERCGPMPVGSRQPNAWQIFDTAGNVAEWVWEAYGTWGAGPQTDPVGTHEGRNRVARGGSWMDVAERCRSAARESSQGLGRISVGFRLVRTLRR